MQALKVEKAWIRIPVNIQNLLLSNITKMNKTKIPRVLEVIFASVDRRKKELLLPGTGK